MRKILPVLIFAVIVAMLLPTVALGAGPRADVTVIVEDPALFVTVASGGEVATFYHRAGGAGITASLPLTDRYVFSAADARPAYDIFVLEGNQVVAASWIPDQKYTPGGAAVGHPGVFTVIREVTPKSGYSVAPAPVPVGNDLQLRIVDPRMVVVVQDGDIFETFDSRPQGVTIEMPSAGPYIASAANHKAMDLLVFDAGWNLVGRSFEWGKPYTRYHAPIPGPGSYWVFKQNVPEQMIGKKIKLPGEVEMFEQ